MTIGEKILNLRKARGWSQEELAEHVGVTRQAVSRWESDSAKPDADKIIAVCDLFGVSADYLLRDIAGMALEETPAKQEKYGKNTISFIQLSGLVLLCMGVLLVTILAVFGSIHGGTHYIVSGDGRDKVYYGMMALVTVNHLEWLLWLLGGITAMGILLLFWKPGVNLLRRYKEII